jgi:DNA-directed RNA polymerase sigma subunit (sigma70/sigma32)
MQASNRLTQELRQQPTPRELAATLDLSERKVRHLPRARVLLSHSMCPLASTAMMSWETFADKHIPMPEE